jgi:hypothetical protein
MRFTKQIGAWSARAFFGMVLATISMIAQQKPQPVVSVDLKPLGAAADLFADSSDSKYQQRGVISLFWLGNDRVAVAFSTNRRWSGDEKPGPLHVHLVIFDRSGKQLNERDWNFNDEGPDSEMTLELAPGPDNSILAIHETAAAAGKIPEGNFVQVFNEDTSRRQDFYIPSTSMYLSAVSPEPFLALQTFYADKHSSLTWWSGRPLKPGLKLDLPRGDEETVAGPEVAARAICIGETLCSGLRIFHSGYAVTNPTASIDIIPVPRAFLSGSSLLVELRHPDQKPGDLVLQRQDGSKVTLAPLPKGLQMFTVSSVARDGNRFSLDAGGEVGICGAFDFWCKQRGLAIVYDIPSNRVLFEQEISATGGVSALSPDGHEVAIFDRDKFSIYPLQ